jgi:hypothetical protein
MLNYASEGEGTTRSDPRWDQVTPERLAVNTRVSNASVCPNPCVKYTRSNCLRCWFSNFLRVTVFLRLK